MAEKNEETEKSAETKKGTTRRMRRSAKRDLVIVESPAKARTINKYLGRSYVVKASMGHIRDLPAKRFGIDLDNNFEPTYVSLTSKKDTINDLRKAVKDANKVYLAPDMDREGEAIAWHLVEALKIPPDKAMRVTFNQITKKAIQEAFEHPTKIDMDKVNAQQARRILDRIVGYKLSPLLWKKITKGLSAGRVQSVAMRLIADREKEIRAFTPQEFWRIGAKLQGRDNAQFEAALRKVGESVVDEEPFPLTNETVAHGLVDSLKNSTYTVTDVQCKERAVKPNPPFITSTLQQEASTRLRFSSKKTMLIAQQLYEGVEVGEEGPAGLISYMRTDSTNVAPEALNEAREYVDKQFGAKYLPKEPHEYKQNKRAQAAHECIRPTGVARDPDAMRNYLSQDQYRLYKMIWKRFIACQMESAVVENTTIDVQAKGRVGDTDTPVEFRVNGKRILFDGWKRVWHSSSDDEVQTLPECKQGDTLSAAELTPSQHFTQPPPRFTEASLIRTLEREGIGRPSTYATILSTIQDRGYVTSEDRKFFATDLGMLVTDKLVKHFPEIVDSEFTAKMEDDLDKIEEAKTQWQGTIGGFYKVFAADLEKAMNEMQSEKEGQEPTGQACELCSKPMVVRWSRRGKFLGCSGYPDCKNIRPLAEDGSAPAAPAVEVAQENCENCGKQMVVRTGRAGRFLACSGYPECKTTKPIPGEEKQVPHQEFDCSRCGKRMIVRWSRRGPFYACSGYPECKNTVSMDKEGKPIFMEEVKETCEKCGAPMSLKYSPRRRSKFLACTAYPKCRSTKPYKKAEEGEKQETVDPA